uniref:Uncharacterized protein n=1 Tax=Tanacetum cinerariifolium TaxID=118510 RepID=A0A699HNE2_TANCI|nr:hypothetical protein [Tanacetum cinerariifolium]
MKLALRARNKFIFVDGSCLKESYATINVLFAQWDTCSAIVLTWHMNYVSQDVYMGLVYYDNAASFWKELKSTCDKVDGFMIFKREFDALIKLPKCVCEVKYSFAASSELVLYQHLMKLMHFLMGLDDCYQPIRSALLTRDPLPILKYAYTTVSREETHRGIPESSSVSEYTLNATSFAAKSFNNNKRNFNNNRVDITSLNISIGHHNGTLAAIIHVGNLKLFNNVVLYDVLVVLGYCVSLLFVNKLIRDSKMYVGFDEDTLWSLLDSLDRL